MQFTFDQLSKNISSAVKALGYKEPTDIQAQAIPLLLEKDTDMVGQAQTGTGKTAAFCLPLLEKIDFHQRGIQAVILSPTRELANQINDELMKFGAHTPLRTVTVYGGVGYRQQLDGVRNSHVVIATPGRAIDLLERGQLKLNDCKIFVIDEADEMLKMGFIEDVDTLLEKTPQDSLKWMFSATMPREIVELMEKKLNSPEIVRVRKSTLSNKSITQTYTCLERRDFFKALKTILLTESDFYGIVFCETREETKNLAERLFNNGVRAAALHGDLNQNQRDLAMSQFKERRIKVLVCTDVAARGVDVTDVTHVINMGLPRKPDSYVHRIGRTGRAGKDGKAISFVTPSEARNLRAIERLINDKLVRLNIPDATKTKQKKVVAELGRMDGLKEAIRRSKETEEEFKMDQCFDLFDEYLEGMSREDVIKLMFSYQFTKDLKQIDEAVLNFRRSIVERSARSDSRGGDRRGRRNDRRNGRGRDGRRGDGRRDGRRGDDRRGDGRRGDGRRGDRSEGCRFEGRRSIERRDGRRSEDRNERRGEGGRRRSRDGNRGGRSFRGRG